MVGGRMDEAVRGVRRRDCIRRTRWELEPWVDRVYAKFVFT